MKSKFSSMIDYSPNELTLKIKIKDGGVTQYSASCRISDNKKLRKIVGFINEKYNLNLNTKEVKQRKVNFFGIS